MDWALAYAKAGYKIIPCYLHPEGHKPPIFKDWRERATSDPKTIRSWFTTQWKIGDVIVRPEHVLIGLPTGAVNGIDAVDIDRKHGVDGREAIPACESLSSVVSETPNDGRHAFGRHDPGLKLKNQVGRVYYNNRTIELPGVDIRTTGGYVIAPGSTFPDGRSYRFIKGDLITETGGRAMLTELDVAMLTRHARQRSRAASPETANDDAHERALEHLRARAEHCAEASEGTRDVTVNEEIFKAAAFINADLVTREEVEEIFQTAKASGLGDRVIDEKLRRALDDGLRKGVDLPSSFARPERKRGRHGREEGDDTFAFNVINAASVTPKRQSWLWPGRIPMGAFTLLIGEPGQGKSHLYVDLVARLTCGDAMPNAEEEKAAKLPPGRVIIFCTEDRLDTTLVPRLMAAGADLTRVDFIQNLKNEDGKARGFDITQDVARLAAVLRSRPDTSLVVFDPISESLGTKIDSHNNTAVRAACGPLAQTLGEHDVAGIGVSHLAKTKTGSVKTAAIGSVAFTAIARSLLWITDEIEVARDEQTGATKQEPTGRKLLLLGKANLAPEEKYPGLAFSIEERELRPPGSDLPIFIGRVRWEGEVDGSTSAYWGGGDTGAKPKAIDEAARFIRQAMLDPDRSRPGKPVYRERLSTEVEGEAAKAGVSTITLRRARDRFDIAPYKRTGDGKAVWPVPGEWLADQEDMPF